MASELKAALDSDNLYQSLNRAIVVDINNAAVQESLDGCDLMPGVVETLGTQFGIVAISEQEADARFKAIKDALKDIPDAGDPPVVSAGDVVSDELGDWYRCMRFLPRRKRT